MVYLGLVDEPEETEELPERFGKEPVDVAAAGVDGDENVTPLYVPEPGAPHVRAMKGVSQVHVGLAMLEHFDDVEGVGRRYQAGQPVVFDTSRLDAVTARRVVDFLSGMTYALRGRVTRVTPRAFLVKPLDVEIPAIERERLAAEGYPIGGGFSS
jgi:FtsZ-interacting cell division protein YlmF